jgi:hypothetical protein
VAERRSIGRELEVSGLGLAQSTGCGPPSDPYGIRPRLPIHWRTALGCGRGPRSPPHPIKSAVWSDFFTQSCRQSLWCSVSSAGSFRFFRPRPRARLTRQHASAFSKLIRPERKDAKRCHLDSRTPPVEENHQ